MTPKWPFSKELYTFKLWYWRRVLLRKSPMDSKEIKPVNPKGNQPWIFIGRTEAPIVWPPDTNMGQKFGVTIAVQS